MKTQLKRIAWSILSKSYFKVFEDRGFSIRVQKANQGIWVAKSMVGLPKEVKALQPQFRRIEALAEKTSAVGALPLWKGYAALQNYPGDVT